MKDNILTILSGVAGSGKSSLVKDLLDGEHEVGSYRTRVVCLDDIREELCGDANDMSKNDLVFSIAMQRIKTLSAQGFNVIYDATNLTPSRRRDIAKKFKDDFDSIFVIYVKRDLDACLEHNRKRKRHVPEEVVEEQWRKAQEPAMDEGKGLYQVLIM